MDRNRLLIIAGIVAIVAVLALGSLLGVQPQLANATAADQQRQSVANDNTAKQQVLDTLKNDYKGLPALKQNLATLQQSVPPSADMSAFISALDALAGSTGTTIESITVSDAQPYTPPIAPVTPAPTSTPAASGSASTATASPAPAPSAPKPKAPAQVTNPQITAANFVAIPIQVRIGGGYDQALAFVNGLQHGARLFLVTTFASSGSSASGGSSAAPTVWTIGGDAYVLLDGSKTGAVK
ncbi:MAG TPA: hypothetical protein VIJ18_00885 [Microbacteriaceae bacterium]